MPDGVCPEISPIAGSLNILEPSVAPQDVLDINLSPVIQGLQNQTRAQFLGFSGRFKFNSSRWWLCTGDCLAATPCLYPVDATIPPTSVEIIKNVIKRCQMSLGGRGEITLVENNCSKF